MKTFNVWIFQEELSGPTGPWIYGSAVKASSEQEALETAKMRFGLSGQYKIHESI